MRRLLRALLYLAATALVVGVLAMGVFPTRTFLDQRNDTRRASERLAVLRAETAQLEARSDALDSDAEIERQARENYGLVKPGEEAYVVLPPPLPPIDLPELWLVGDIDSGPDPDDEFVAVETVTEPGDVGG